MCYIVEPRIYTYYKSVICQDLIYTCAVQNIMEFPEITQIVLNTSSSSTCAVNGGARLLSGQVALQCIAGEKSKTTRARDSIAAFNIRKNALLGSATHLRGASLVYSFLDQYLTFICTTENTDGPLRSTCIERKTAHERTKNFWSKRVLPSSSFLGNVSQKQIDLNFSRNQLTSFPGIQSHFLTFSAAGGLNCTISVFTGNPSFGPEELFLLLTAFQLPIQNEYNR